MNGIASRTCAGLAVVLLVARLAAAVEPWADERLKVVDGLAAWYDATRIPAAREAGHLPSFPLGGPVSSWADGSGNGRGLLAAQQIARPTLAALGPLHVLKFDGVDDGMLASGAKLSGENWTIVAFASPTANPGDFRGLVAGAELDRNDYQSGFNIDLSGEGSAQFDKLSFEGKGFGGASNLLKESQPFGTWHIIECSLAAGADGAKVFLDGRAQGSRKRDAGPLHIDLLTVGARYYSGSPEPPFVFI